MPLTPCWWSVCAQPWEVTGSVAQWLPLPRSCFSVQECFQRIICLPKIDQHSQWTRWPANSCAHTNLRSFEEHPVGDVMHVGRNSPESDAREDVSVVALSWVERLAVQSDGPEGTSGCKYACPLKRINVLDQLSSCQLWHKDHVVVRGSEWCLTNPCSWKWNFGHKATRLK